MNPLLIQGILGVFLVISAYLIYTLNGEMREENNTKIQGYAVLTFMVGMYNFAVGFVLYFK